MGWGAECDDAGCFPHFLEIILQILHWALVSERFLRNEETHRWVNRWSRTLLPSKSSTQSRSTVQSSQMQDRTYRWPLVLANITSTKTPVSAWRNEQTWGTKYSEECIGKKHCFKLCNRVYLPSKQRERTTWNNLFTLKKKSSVVLLFKRLVKI